MRLNENIPITDSPNKAAQESHFREKISKCKVGKTTAVIGQPFYSGQFGYADKKCHTQTLWRVLLDTGTNGDLYFQKKNKISGPPYVTRAIPQAWHTSHGIFCTEKVGELEIMFPEYSHSKRFSITPDIVEFDDPKLAPPFDLIIGTATMEDLGIILDFETKMIAIDSMNLPMRNIKNLQVPGTQFQI